MDCPTYHYDNARTGWLKRPLLPPVPNSHLVWGKYNEVPLGAAVRGAALFLHDWTISKGVHSGQTHTMVYVATSDNNVVAFSEEQLRSGSTAHLWLTNLGPALRIGGSNIPDPVGVCSTMVLDRGSGRLFVVAMIDSGGGHGVYHVFALDLDTGAILDNETLDRDPGALGRPTFVGSDHDQRCALLLVNSTQLYICFAAYLSDDRGLYHGWVIRCEASALAVQEYVPMTRNVHGGGIWGPGGATAGNSLIYVVTGNAPVDTQTGDPSRPLADDSYWKALRGAPPAHFEDFFEAVAGLTLKTMVAADWYMPDDTKTLNENDQDLGGSSALLAYLDSGGSVLVTGDKAGNVYLLNPTNLGHWGGQLWSEQRFKGEVRCAPAYYLSAKHGDVVILTAHCDPGMIAFQVTHRPELTELWRARTSGGASVAFDFANGSPVVVDGATGGLNVEPGFGGMVWVCDGGLAPHHALQAFSVEDGIEIFNSDWQSAADQLPKVPHYPAINCSDHSVFVGTDQGLSCYRLPWLAQGTRPQFIVYNLDSPSGEDHGYYRFSEDVQKTGITSWGSVPMHNAPNQVPGWFGEHDQFAGGMVAASIRDIGKLDLVVFWIDNRADGNHAYYRIGWDIGAFGRPNWDPQRDTIEVAQLQWGTRTHGGGLAVAEIGGGGRPDLILFHIDHASGGNQGFYSIGWQLDLDGRTNNWTRFPVNAWFGEQSAGGGIAIGQIGGPGQQDLLVFHIDHASGGNQGWYQIGWNIDRAGNVTTWDPRMRIPVPGWFGENNQGASVALADLDDDGRPELIIFHVDHGSGANAGYYRIGWCLDINGNVTGGWTTDFDALPIKIPGWFGTDTRAGSLAVVHLPWRWVWE
jgi:hypothetical protein